MIDLSAYEDKYKTERRIETLLAKGCCPVCEIKLISKYHTNCLYLENLRNETSLRVDEQ